MMDTNMNDIYEQAEANVKGVPAQDDGIMTVTVRTISNASVQVDVYPFTTFGELLAAVAHPLGIDSADFKGKQPTLSFRKFSTADKNVTMEELGVHAGDTLMIDPAGGNG